MKTMNYRNVVCEIGFTDHFHFDSDQECEYCEDAVKYAVTRVFNKSEKIRRYCTRTSWRMRLAKGKEKRKEFFVWSIPSCCLALPGDTTVVKGRIDQRGVFISKISLKF